MVGKEKKKVKKEAKEPPKKTTKKLSCPVKGTTKDENS